MADREPCDGRPETAPALGRAVFVSCAYPRDLGLAKHGGYQRMGLLLLALSEITDHLDVVLFRQAGSVARFTNEELEAYLSETWHVRAAVTQIVTAEDSQPRGLAGEYLRPLVRPLDHAVFPGVVGQAGVETLSGLVRSGVDLIVTHDLYSMKPLLSAGALAAPIVMDLDDIEHKTMLRTLRQPPHYPGKALLLAQAVSMALCERQLIRRTAATLVCSEGDRRWLRRVLGVRHIEVVPNSARLPDHISPPPASGQVLFLGAFSYRPNVRAAEWLLGEIWPRVLAQRPSARLVIAGAHPERIPSYAERAPSVRFAGFVEDLDQLYRETQVVVCPIASGGGTRIKIIEAAVHTRPVVSTTLGAEGLAFKHPDEIRLHDDPASFANACSDLLASSVRCEEIGVRARKTALAHYSPEAVRALARTIYLRSAGLAQRVVAGGAAPS